MDTEKTLDLNKPLFSYSRYERNEYGYGDDFIHRDGDGVDMTLSSHFAKTVAGAMSRNSMRKRSPVSMKSLQRRTASKRVS